MLVVIVEGAKKAACLLSAGYAAIAIPGVNAGYRTPQDESIQNSKFKMNTVLPLVNLSSFRT